VQVWPRVGRELVPRAGEAAHAEESGSMAKELRAAGTTEEVLARIDAWDRRDAQAEAGKRKWGVWIAVAALGVVGSLLLACASVYLGLLAAPALAALVYCIVMYSREARLDFEDRKMTAAAALLSVLAQDVPRKGKCQVVVTEGNLRLIDRQKTGGMLHPRRLDTLQGNWLEVRADLADGNDLAVNVERTERRKYKYKKNTWRLRGTRAMEEIQVKVRLNPATYPNHAGLNPGALVPPPTDPDLAMRRARIVPGPRPALAVDLVANGGARPELLLGAVSLAYELLAPARPQPAQGA